MQRDRIFISYRRDDARGSSGRLYDWLRIAFGRGVCGAAAASGQTQLVPDVHAFPGHIACDGRSQSEVVVPVFDAAGALIAVLDVDSDRPAAFDEVDAHWLEKIVRDTFAV